MFRIFLISSLCGAVALSLAWWLRWEDAPEVSQWRRGLYGEDCWFEAPTGIAPDYRPSCATLHTDRGDEFALPVVIFRYVGESPRRDPLIYLAGGPGSSHGFEPENVESWFYWLEEAALSRDLIVMDQRGTGLAKPMFECPEYRRFLRSALTSDLAAKQEYNSAFNVIERCLRQVEERGFDPADYSSSKSVDDLQQLMGELPYEQWNVLGVSYGTRVALDWARRNDPGLRALVLDSVYPVDKGALTEWPGLLSEAFERFWRACRVGDLCEDKARNSEEKFWQALKILGEKPKQIRISLWNGDWPMEVIVNDQRFFNVVYHSFYNESVYPEIIQAIDEILLGGDSPALQELVEREVNSELAPEFNVLTFLAVNCGEIPQGNKDAFERARAQFPQLMPFTDLAWEYDYCHLFPRRADLDIFRETVSSEIPALILAGEFDPVTPASWAKHTAENFGNAQVRVLNSTGHGVVSHSPCVHKSLTTFLDAPQDQWQPACTAAD